MNLLFRAYLKCKDDKYSHMLTSKISMASIMRDHIRGCRYAGEGWYHHNNNTNNKDVYTISRSCGIKDKNGINIFTGDIIQYTKHDGYLLESFQSEVVVNENGAWGYMLNGVFYSFDSCDEPKKDIYPHIQVIGNKRD